MIWVEIVFHKEIDWRTVVGCNVKNLSREEAIIPTNWVEPSDCMPEWSDQGYRELPLVVLKDAEDDCLDEDDVDDDSTPMTFGERHEH